MLSLETLLRSFYLNSLISSIMSSILLSTHYFMLVIEFSFSFIFLRVKSIIALVEHYSCSVWHRHLPSPQVKSDFWLHLLLRQYMVAIFEPEQIKLLTALLSWINIAKRILTNYKNKWFNCKFMDLRLLKSLFLTKYLTNCYKIDIFVSRCKIIKTKLQETDKNLIDKREL